MLDHALVYPCHGAVRVEQELQMKGIQVSAGGIRGVWQRHGLLTTTAERKIGLSDEQARMLERFSREFRERQRGSSMCLRNATAMACSAVGSSL